MPGNKKQTGDMVLTANLWRLVVIRMFAIACECIVVGVAVYALKMHLPVLPLLSIIATHLLLNLATWQWLRVSNSVSAWVFFVQLCLDVTVLAMLLYFTGGATNPFVSLLLLPLVVAAAVLAKIYAWIMALLVVAVYAVLMVMFQHMPHVGSGAGHDFDWHVTGMWFSFLLGVALIVFFVLRMAESLRERDHNLAEARERAIRDEKLVALGTLAAGAAHELGTPLSTMAIVAKDLTLEYTDNEELAPRLSILQQQIKRCKDILSMISASSGQMKADSGSRLRLDDFLETVVVEWRSIRPQAHLDFRLDGVQPAPWIVAETGLSQAIITFLDNAADASPNDIEMICQWRSTRLSLTISDRGEGIAPEFMAHLGKNSFTTKAEGYGLGLLLAHANIERLGGNVVIRERAGGGACIYVELDLTRLWVDD